MVPWTNGAGKNDDLRLLCALIAPTSGTAEIAGFRLGRDDARIRAAVGILTELPGLYERQSAWDNLVFFATLYGLPTPVANGQAEKYLRLMGLWDRKKEPVVTFSRGMKQKMAIARAALHEPRVIFLDEPTTGLDPDAAKTVRECIVALRGEGRTVFLCTHNMDEATGCATIASSHRCCGSPTGRAPRWLYAATESAQCQAAGRRPAACRPSPGPRAHLRERLDRRRLRGSAADKSAPREGSRRRRRRCRVRHRAKGASRGCLSPDRGADRMTAAVLAASPTRPTLVRAVCVREWREALGNKLLVG